MLKSGLIVGAISFVLALVGSFIISLICGPCVAIFGGLGAGYLAGMFDKQGMSGASAKSGASAGAIAGVGALIGQIIGSVVNAAIMGPARAAETARALGLPADGTGGAGFYLGAGGIGCCLGLFEVALMAGLGALGGILWYQISGKNSATTMTPPATM